MLNPEIGAFSEYWTASWSSAALLGSFVIPPAIACTRKMLPEKCQHSNRFCSQLNIVISDDNKMK